MVIEIKFSRSNRTYRVGELVEGKIVMTLTSPVSYQKILLSLNGAVHLQVGGGLTGVIESLYSVVKPISIVKKSIELVALPGKLVPGRTEISFSFYLSSEEKNNCMFYETFHGGNISIQVVFLIAKLISLIFYLIWTSSARLF
ncbi:hypothetical protein HPP92_023536 [Vanilla planifolia]|uniref:Uncharacterized protein n=1 Tax=Vanilla planifolia TaxID=51239 RepID=A0A835PR14_VANPL|nr:hypothetical protein HPP92_023536 [Vanilla planifolia]